MSLPTVVVADDEPRIRQLMELVLVDLGCNVISCADGWEASGVLRSRDWDLALLDLRMPGKNGHEILAEIRASPRTASLPVVVVTALLPPGQALKDLPAKDVGLIAKPFALCLLEATVRSALASRGKPLPGRMYYLAGEPPEDQQGG